LDEAERSLIVIDLKRGRLWTAYENFLLY
jgi:hypothetical protein